MISNPTPKPRAPRRWLRHATVGVLLPVLGLSAAQGATYYHMHDTADWNTAADWKSTSIKDDPVAVSPPSVSSADHFIAGRTAARLRSGSGATTFGGASLTMGSTHYLGVGGGTSVQTLPVLITRDTPSIRGGNTTSNLVINDATVQSGRLDLRNHSHTNATFNITIGTLNGKGDVTSSRPGTFSPTAFNKLTLTDATSFQGTFTVETTRTEFMAPVSFGGTLDVPTPGNLTVNHPVIALGLVVNGTTYGPGNYTAGALGFDGAPGTPVTVRLPATWHLTTNQTSGQDWTQAHASQWKANANGSGASAPSINIVDTYVHATSTHSLRTPTGTSTFRGGVLQLGGSAKLTLLGGSSAISTVPQLVATGGTIEAGSGTRNLAMDTFSQPSGTTTFTTTSGGVLNLHVEHLTGAGNFNVSGAGQFRPHVDHGNHYTGTITVNSGATLNVQTQFGTAGALVVNTGGTVVLNNWVYVTALTANGQVRGVGDYTAAQLGAGFSGTGRIVVYTRDLNGPPLMFGVNLAGAEFDDHTFWQTNPAVWDYYRNKGLTLIRLPFKWERVQSSLNVPVNFSNLDACVDLARARGMKVILDMHNYNKYSGVRVGTGAVTYQAFADTWAQIAAHYAGDPAIYAYDLMNEPEGSEENWAAAAQHAMDAIRKHDQTAYVFVEGMSYSSAENWPNRSGSLDIKDPVGRLVYSAHTYWDSKRSTLSNGKENYASDGIYIDDEPRAPNRGVEKVQPFIDWLQTRPYAHGNIGEYGVPSNYNSADWNIVLHNFLAHLRANNITGTYWAGGANWGNYNLSCHPASLTSGPDKPQMAVLEQFNNKHLDLSNQGALSITGVVASSQQSGNEAFKSYDGNVSSRWAAEGTQTIRWDLGSTKALSRVKIAFYLLRSYSFKIDASTDGATWTPVVSTRSSSGTTEDFETFVFSSMIEARYIRYTGYGSNANAWNSIREVELIGPVPPPSGSVLPIYGVSASSQQSGNGAGNTYDGDLNTRWAADGTQSIQWDVGSALGISQVKLAFYQLRQYSFKIDASIDGSTWTAVLPIQSSSGTTEQLETFAFPAPANARYIRYTGYGSNAGTWNNIREVELIAQ